MEHIFIID